MRSALVDYFREQGRIMIATEAGAEGINLQFCSLVVNYDLPWNPQRIEQRIGRCHRYGQKHDVVVVNFLNRNNAADQRVFQLLVGEVQAVRGHLRSQRRGARGHRVGRGLREAHRGHLPAVPEGG
jgi:ERCC4-related helicase